MQLIKSFLPFVLIQTIAQILVLLIGLSFSNNDSREILVSPVLQVVLLVVFSAYSLLFAIIDQIHPSTSKRILQFSTILGVALIIHAYLFFSVSTIDNNSKELTLYQSVVKSDFMVFGIMALLLVVQLISKLKEKSSSV